MSKQFISSYSDPDGAISSYSDLDGAIVSDEATGQTYVVKLGKLWDMIEEGLCNGGLFIVWASEEIDLIEVSLEDNTEISADDRGKWKSGWESGRESRVSYKKELKAREERGELTFEDYRYDYTSTINRANDLMVSQVSADVWYIISPETLWELIEKSQVIEAQEARICKVQWRGPCIWVPLKDED